MIFVSHDSWLPCNLLTMMTKMNCNDERQQKKNRSMKKALLKTQANKTNKKLWLNLFEMLPKSSQMIAIKKIVWSPHFKHTYYKYWKNEWTNGILPFPLDENLWINNSLNVIEKKLKSKQNHMLICPTLVYILYRTHGKRFNNLIINFNSSILVILNRSFHFDVSW